ncbi:transcriptional regulator, TetR family [Gracilibacillus orientalis]|uniref:Transcriptional regulator, TetR family n=1 Tax=Gracilibacillus orientalis TaxID=334253 RepID=A0A1I4JZ22_9BACI|nr:TetR/AcrR family transcriptional regulator [Gracilibacillus orientalis]SFL71507.1 transcriptional regulator, TetR family [Gracilibacillus orientalis]
MSIQKQEDPRAIRSKKMFKNAVLSLLIEKPSISQLTVQKIADRAELNRATFYLHYQDIYDLLKQITDEIFDELSIKLRPLMKGEIILEREQLTVFLDYIYENRKYFGVLFEYKSFETNLFNLFKNLIETRRNDKQNELPKNYVSIDIRTASLMGIIMWWIKDGIHFSSEYIANQISLMFER